MSQQHQQKCASLYYKSEDLKKVLHSQSKNILKESSSWLRLNEFVEINKKLVLIDLDYAIEKKSEVDLWNVAFKEVIDGLRKEAADTKLSQFQMSNLEKTKKTEAQTSLSWFLDFASGFYVLLLQEICVTYDLDLPFLRYYELAFSLIPTFSGAIHKRIRPIFPILRPFPLLKGDVVYGWTPYSKWLRCFAKN